MTDTADRVPGFLVAMLSLDREVDFADHASVKPLLCAAFAPKTAPRCPRRLSLEAGA